MEKDRDYFKKLLASGQLDALYEELFALLGQRKSDDRLIAAKFDDLTLLSGKRTVLEQHQELGMLSMGEFNTEMSRHNAALLDLLNELPHAAFLSKTQAGAASPTAWGIPAVVANGLYWVLSTLIGMIWGGSLIQQNYLTAALTGLSLLLCMPLTYQWLSDLTHIRLRNSLRIALVFLLLFVGLSYATNAS